VRCPGCDYRRMWQDPYNKYLLSCPECNTTMRNPKWVNQTSFEDGELVQWKKKSG